MGSATILDTGSGHGPSGGNLTFTQLQVDAGENAMFEPLDTLQRLEEVSSSSRREWVEEGLWLKA